MRHRIGWGPAAFAVSLLALILSLGGTGYALTAQAPAPARLPAWHNLFLAGGWKYAGYDSYPAGVYKDSQSVVHLRGSAFGGSTGKAAFTLPRGDRPGRTLWLSIYAFNGSTGGLEVQPSGKAFFFDNNGGGNVKNYASLDGVSFRVP